MTEHEEQAAVVSWWQAQQMVRPELADIVLAAIPNGGHRARKTAVALKAEGVLAGMPDLMLCCARHRWHHLYLEMKANGNRASKVQLDVHRRLRAADNAVVVCQGWIEAVRAICWYLDIEEVL